MQANLHTVPEQGEKERNERFDVGKKIGEIKQAEADDREIPVRDATSTLYPYYNAIYPNRTILHEYHRVLLQCEIPESRLLTI